MNAKTSALDRTLVVINPASARASRAWTRIRSRLTETGVYFDVQKTSWPGDAEGLVRAALNEGYRTIAVIGGDGTLSEAVRGFFEKPTPSFDSNDSIPHRIGLTASLAILPAGTGDDFARGLTGKRAPLETWLDKLIAHCRQPGNDEKTTRLVDTIYATVDNGKHRFVCINAVTLGISAEVATRVRTESKVLHVLPGEARFAIASLPALVKWRNHSVRLTVDENSTICSTNLIVVANGPFVGGGMHVMPGALPYDGRLDVITANGLSRAQVLREFARIHRGGHLANPKVQVLSGTSARIETIEPAKPLPIEADGDFRGHTPAAFRIMANSLRIVW